MRGAAGPLGWGVMSRRRAAPLLTLALAALPWDVLAQTGTTTTSFRIGYQADGALQAPLSVTFYAAAPAEYRIQWDFGDGTGAQGPAQAHVYYRPGTYEVGVTLLDARGRVAGQSSLKVNVVTNGPERAELTLLPGRGQLRVSGQGSVVYAPAAPQLTVNGQAVAAGAATRVGNGRVTVQSSVRSSAGTLLSKSVQFTMADLGGSAPFELEVLRLTNQARAGGWNCQTLKPGGRALAPLKQDAALDEAALAQSAGMALAGYFAHESALDGSTPLRRAQATGARFQVVAENIAAGQETPQEVVTGWLRSPGHCKNIMGDFTRIGLSFVNRPGTKYVRYWTQVFAQP